MDSDSAQQQLVLLVCRVPPPSLLFGAMSSPVGLPRLIA
jgi:hypothetical protein